MLGLKSPSERKLERLERAELARALKAGEDVSVSGAGNVITSEGREYVDASDEHPCPLHPEWTPRRWLSVQPRQRNLYDCPFCRDGALAARRRERRPIDVAHPIYGELEGRFNEALAEFREKNEAELIRSGNVALVDQRLEEQMLDRIDAKRDDELDELRLTPEQRFAKRRRAARRFWSRNL